MGSDDAALSVRGKEALDQVAADLTQPSLCMVDAGAMWGSRLEWGKPFGRLEVGQESPLGFSA